MHVSNTPTCTPRVDSEWRYKTITAMLQCANALTDDFSFIEHQTQQFVALLLVIWGCGREHLGHRRHPVLLTLHLDLLQVQDVLWHYNASRLRHLNALLEDFGFEHTGGGVYITPLPPVAVAANTQPRTQVTFGSTTTCRRCTWYKRWCRCGYGRCYSGFGHHSCGYRCCGVVLMEAMRCRQCSCGRESYGCRR